MRIKAELKIYEAKAHNVKQRAHMKSLWNKFAGDCPDLGCREKIFNLLCDLYSQKHRAYHNLGHVKFLLALFEELEDFIEDKSSIYFAVWFHDAVYDPQKKDNEKQSANLAARCLKKLCVPENKISKIERIILATEKHSADNLDTDGRLFLDFDLAILGAEIRAYNQYVKAIRREYSFMSAENFKTGRSEFLQNLLRRDFIYLTDPMREKFETRARRNIVWEMEKL